MSTHWRNSAVIYFLPHLFLKDITTSQWAEPYSNYTPTLYTNGQTWTSGQDTSYWIVPAPILITTVKPTHWEASFLRLTVKTATAIYAEPLQHGTPNPKSWSNTSSVMLGTTSSRLTERELPSNVLPSVMLGTTTSRITERELPSNVT